MENKSTQIVTRVKTQEQEIIFRGASFLGIPSSTFLKISAMEKARNLIKQNPEVA